MTAGNLAAILGVSFQRPNKPFQSHLYQKITPSPLLPTYCKVLTVLSDSLNNSTTGSSNMNINPEEILCQRASCIHVLIYTCAGVWVGCTDSERTLYSP